MALRKALGTPKDISKQMEALSQDAGPKNIPYSARGDSLSCFGTPLGICAIHNAPNGARWGFGLRPYLLSYGEIPAVLLLVRLSK